MSELKFAKDRLLTQRATVDHQVQLPVSLVSAARLVVGKGSIVWKKQELKLEDDEYIDVEVQAVDQILRVYLVREGAVLHVLYDCVLADGKDVSYGYQSRSSKYETVHLLMSAVIPANETLTGPGVIADRFEIGVA